ncbi:MAG: glycosyltransferase [Cypionkella sp.]|uniref:glycosyltransferase n=1 Tax=Cypionkella sp. TaxID=2811411 RepID=UPI002716D42B|nr:glycosyltransferase [Cypionkella sp.]MDO8327928.1 glycosyltransferase [Cypionkella sp.]
MAMEHLLPHRPIAVSGLESGPTATPAIAILLACYNGAANLAAQLDSFCAQTVAPALLIVSDDGSKDASRAILADFAAAHPELPVQLIEGPRQGAAQNFLHLLRAVPPEIDMVAISDQDDVWLPEKLARGAAALAGQAQPALSTGSSWVCDAGLTKLCRMPVPARPPSFRHALVQNIAGGNTMMLNRAALALLQAASLEARKLVVHDWWIYQIIAGVGGVVLYDPEPVLLYRQHAGNLIGANHGFVAKSRRLKLLLIGRFRRWNSINIKTLTPSAHRFTAQNRQILQDFERLRRMALLPRLQQLKRLGLYRQGLAGNLSLWLAAVLGKI